MIRYRRKTYTLLDQKSVLAPAKRLTGGLNGAFSFFSCLVRALFAQEWVKVEVSARLDFVAVDVPTQDRLCQAFAITALPSAGFSRRRTPSLAFVRHEVVEVFCNLNTSTICFIGSTRHAGSLAKCAWTQSRVSTTSYRL